MVDDGVEPVNIALDSIAKDLVINRQAAASRVWAMQLPM